MKLPQKIWTHLQGWQSLLATEVTGQECLTPSNQSVQYVQAGNKDVEFTDHDQVVDILQHDASTVFAIDTGQDNDDAKLGGASQDDLETGQAAWKLDWPVGSKASLNGMLVNIEL